MADALPLPSSTLKLWDYSKGKVSGWGRLARVWVVWVPGYGFAGGRAEQEPKQRGLRAVPAEGSGAGV